MLEAFGASDAGCVRSNNEDTFLIVPTLGLYAVADGMGGAQAGELASKLATEALQDAVGKRASEPGAALLVQAFRQANAKVMQEASKDSSLEGMGTTMVAVLAGNSDLWVASVGDSRAYLFDSGRLQAITEDQTWVNEVGRRLGIDEETLKVHPMRHVLTMAIGVSEQLRILTYVLKPAPGALILLCSDGLHGVALEEDISKVLASQDSLEQKCAGLIAAAKQRGGPDNITVVLLQAH